MVDVPAHPVDVADVGGSLVGQDDGSEPVGVGDDQADHAVDRRDGHVPVVGAFTVDLDEPAVDGPGHPCAVEAADLDAVIDGIELVDAEQHRA